MKPNKPSPNVPLSTRRCVLVALAATSFASLFVAAGDAWAQATPPAPANAQQESSETVELSPFVVTEAGETGWIATETLAGSRIRTDLRDVPNQIETLTKEFMQDLGLNNLDEALIYTANSESISDYSTLTPGDEVNFPASPGRVRGVGTGTRSRNFFQIGDGNATDNYNLERATVASGPHAILFGLGSPAGIFEASPARALMRNRYGFTLRYDSENSKRATFDANVVVVPQKLSFRLMGLSQRVYTEKKPNFDRNDRVYGTLTFKPFKNTTLSVQGERNSRSFNKAGRTTAIDFVTPWLIADQVPGSGYAAPKPLFDNAAAGAFTAIANNRIFNQQTENPVMIQGDAGAMQSWRNSVFVRSPSTLPGVDPTFDAGATYSILDPSIFPFDVNPLGNSRANALGGYTKTVILEQKITDQLFLELAYNRDDSTRHILALGGNASGGNFRLDVDPNRFIPGTTTPNPHAGEYFFQGTSSTRLHFDDNEAWRATLSYQVNLARKLGERSAWLKWLGHHRLSGLYSGTKEEVRDQQNFDRRILDDPVLPGVTLRARTFQNWATHPTRLPQFRHYLGNPYAANRMQGPIYGDWTLNDANGRPYQLYSFDTPLRAADGKRLGAGSGAGGTKNKANAVLFVWQGYFLPDREQRDRLVLTYGYRRDAARSAGFDSASVRQDFSGLFPVIWDAQYGDYGPEKVGINRNAGFVVRPFRWLSLSYNKSTTFDLNIGRFDPFGNELPGAGGEGRDYGIRLDLWKDKLALKVNKYETSLGPTRAANQINTFRNQFLNIENRVLALDPNLPRINVNDGNQRGFPSQPFSSYNISSYSSGEGYEAELNFSPTRNWNIRLNGAKGESTETNIGADWFQWLEQRLPVWEGVTAKNGEVDSAGRPVTWNTAALNVNQPTGQTLAQYYQSALVGQAIAFITAVEGRSNPSVRDGRVNLIANYRFSEGRLKGFNIGGALRYRAAPIIGYGVKTNASGTRVLDLDTKYRGEAERFVDFMAGYRGRLKAFGGINYRLQLNIRNLLNENDPIPVNALTTGAVSRIATVDSRLTALTFGVDF